MRFYVEFLMEVWVLVGSSVVYMTQGLILLPNEKTETKSAELTNSCVSSRNGVSSNGICGGRKGDPPDAGS